MLSSADKNHRARDLQVISLKDGAEPNPKNITVATQEFLQVPDFAIISTKTLHLKDLHTHQSHLHISKSLSMNL